MTPEEENIYLRRKIEEVYNLIYSIQTDHVKISFPTHIKGVREEIVKNEFHIGTRQLCRELSKYIYQNKKPEVREMPMDYHTLHRYEFCLWKEI